MLLYASSASDTKSNEDPTWGNGAFTKALIEAFNGAAKQATDEQRMVDFRDYLNSHGVICTIRRSRGEDIFAACGMLAGKNLNN